MHPGGFWPGAARVSHEPSPGKPSLRWLAGDPPENLITWIMDSVHSTLFKKGANHEKKRGSVPCARGRPRARIPDGLTGCGSGTEARREADRRHPAGSHH